MLEGWKQWMRNLCGCKKKEKKNSLELEATTESPKKGLGRSGHDTNDFWRKRLRAWAADSWFLSILLVFRWTQQSVTTWKAFETNHRILQPCWSRPLHHEHKRSVETRFANLKIQNCKIVQNRKVHCFWICDSHFLPELWGWNKIASDNFSCYEAYEKLQTPQKRLLRMKKCKSATNVFLPIIQQAMVMKKRGSKINRGARQKKKKQQNLPCALIGIQFNFKAIKTPYDEQLA